jgi:outer membrane protein TolC
MTRLEELEAKRAAAEAAVNAAADTAWDEAAAAYAAYDAAWDAVDAYKAELKKQQEKSYHNVSNQPEMGGSNIGVLEGDEQ